CRWRRAWPACRSTPIQPVAARRIITGSMPMAATSIMSPYRLLRLTLLSFSSCGFSEGRPPPAGALLPGVEARSAVVFPLATEEAYQHGKRHETEKSPYENVEHGSIPSVK